jgi:hypothetical protein
VAVHSSLLCWSIYFCFSGDVYMIFILHSINVVNHNYEHVFIEPSLYPEDKSCWLW